MPRVQNAGTLRATAEIQDRVSDPLRQIDRQIAGLAGGGASSLLRFASIGGGALASVGAAALAAGQEYTEALDIIATGTGATGDVLAGLGDDLEGALGTSSTSAADLAQALAALNTATGETGEGLTTATAAAGRFAQVFEVDAGATAKTTGQILQQFNLDAADTEHVLDLATAASQRYGVGASAVLEQVRQFGPVLENAGFGLEQTISLFGRLEASGIDVTRVMPGFNQAIRRLANEGVTDLDGAINSAIEQIRSLDSESEALSIAERTFGAEGAARLVAAIRDGAIPAVSELGTEFDDAAGSLVATQREVTTWADLASASWGRVVGAVGGLFDLSPPDWLTRLLFEGSIAPIRIEVEIPDIGSLDYADVGAVRQLFEETAAQIENANANLATLQQRLEDLRGTRAYSSQAPQVIADIETERETLAGLEEQYRQLETALGEVGPAYEAAAEASATVTSEYDKATAKLREQLSTLPTVAERVRRLQVQHRLSARNAELDARAQRAFRDALEVVTLAARPAFVALDDGSEAAERLRRANEPLASSTIDLGDAYETLGPGVERAVRLLRSAVSPSEALAQAEADAAQRALEAAEAQAALGASLQDTGGAISRFGSTVGNVDPTIGRFIGGIGLATESVGNLLAAVASGAASGPLGVLNVGLSVATGLFGFFSGGASEADRALEEFNEEQRETADLLADVQSGAISAGDALQQFADNAEYAAFQEQRINEFLPDISREQFDVLRQFEADLISIGVSAEDAAAEVDAIAADGIIDEQERQRIADVAQSANDLADGLDRARENADSAADAGLRLVANLDSRNPFDRWFADASAALDGLGVDIESVLGDALSAADLSEAFQRSQLRPEDVTRAADVFGIGAGLEGEGAQTDLLRELGGAEFSAIFDTAALTDYATALETLALSGVDAFEVLANASDEQRDALFGTIEAAVNAGQSIPTALQPIIDARREQLAAQETLNAEQQRELDLLNSLPDDAYSDLTRDQQIFLTGVSAIIEALGRDVPDAITNLLNPAVESAAETGEEGAQAIAQAYDDADAERLASAGDATAELIALDRERVDQAVQEWQREHAAAAGVLDDVRGMIESLPGDRTLDLAIRISTFTDGNQVSDAVLGAVADRLPDELRRRGYI